MQKTPRFNSSATSNLTPILRILLTSCHVDPEAMLALMPHPYTLVVLTNAFSYVLLGYNMKMNPIRFLALSLMALTTTPTASAGRGGTKKPTCSPTAKPSVSAAATTQSPTRVSAFSWLICQTPFAFAPSSLLVLVVAHLHVCFFFLFVVKTGWCTRGSANAIVNRGKFVRLPESSGTFHVFCGTVFFVLDASEFCVSRTKNGKKGCLLLHTN